MTEGGLGGTCADGKALLASRSVTVSPDGSNVYVASEESQAVAVFDRDGTTGALKQLDGTDGCVSQTGTGGECADGRALYGPRSVAVTGDGKNVYVASGAAVAVFARDPVTGALEQLTGTSGCISSFALPDGCAFGLVLGVQPEWPSAPTAKAFTSRRLEAKPWRCSRAIRRRARSRSFRGLPAAWPDLEETTRAPERSA